MDMVCFSFPVRAGRLDHEAHAAGAADALLDLALLDGLEARHAAGEDLPLVAHVALEELDVVHVDDGDVPVRVALAQRGFLAVELGVFALGHGFFLGVL